MFVCALLALTLFSVYQLFGAIYSLMYDNGPGSISGGLSLRKQLVLERETSRSRRATIVTSGPMTVTRSGAQTAPVVGTGSQTGEVTHVAFLKVHKTGGSLIQNLLFRFGAARNLTFVLPKQGHYFSRNANSHDPVLAANEYHILCVPSVFNHTVFSRLLPRDSKYVAIVRDPFNQFVTSAFYYRDQLHFGYLEKITENLIETLILKPESDEGTLTYTRNAMAKDFGFQPYHVDNTTAAMSYLDDISHVFDLVLITEYMDESLVLMKRRFGWSTADILYSSRDACSNSDQVGANQDLISRFRARNALDYMVYNAFYVRFWAELLKEGRDIFDEVNHLRHILKLVHFFCHRSDQDLLPVPKSRWNDPFPVTKQDCHRMATTDLEYVAKLRITQSAMKIDWTM